MNEIMTEDEKKDHNTSLDTVRSSHAAHKDVFQPKAKGHPSIIISHFLRPLECLVDHIAFIRQQLKTYPRAWTSKT